MPEYNLIQAPELLMKLAKRFGIRQAHTSPTLAENVQPVVIVDDIRDNLVSREEKYGAFVSVIPIAGQRAGVEIRNQPGPGGGAQGYPSTGVIVRVDRVTVSAVTSVTANNDVRLMTILPFYGGGGAPFTTFTYTGLGINRRAAGFNSAQDANNVTRVFSKALINGGYDAVVAPGNLIDGMLLDSSVPLSPVVFDNLNVYLEQGTALRIQRTDAALGLGVGIQWAEIPVP